MPQWSRTSTSISLFFRETAPQSFLVAIKNHAPGCGPGMPDLCPFRSSGVPASAAKIHYVGETACQKLATATQNPPVLGTLGVRFPLPAPQDLPCFEKPE